MRINPINLNHVNYNFEHFVKETVQQDNKRDPRYFIREIYDFQKQYSKFGMVDMFCDKLADFAEMLQGKGLKDFAGMVYSSLAKFPINKDTRISILEKAVKNAESQGDKFHVLARVVDLKKLYKDEWMSKQYVRTLLREEKCLKSIVTDFEEAKKNFRVVGNASRTQDDYRWDLAVSKIDIAKATMKQNPKLALSKIKSAKRIFVDLDRPDELEFAEQLENQIKLKHR